MIIDFFKNSWKQNYKTSLIIGICFILFAFLILAEPMILILLFSLFLIYIGMFFIGTAFMIRKFGKESENYNNWIYSDNWFWRW